MGWYSFSSATAIRLMLMTSIHPEAQVDGSFSCEKGKDAYALNPDKAPTQHSQAAKQKQYGHAVQHSKEHL